MLQQAFTLARDKIPYRETELYCDLLQTRDKEATRGRKELFVFRAGDVSNS